MEIDDTGYLILGTSRNGHKFRPSDWVERIATLFASFDAGQRLRYDPRVRPASREDQKCLFVSESLAAGNPDGFNFIMEFAKGNHLQVEAIGQPDSHSPVDEILHVA
jgi:hypothetical protein